MSIKPAEAVPGPIDHSVCALYKPGHQVHFIQAKLGWEGDPAKYRNGTLLSVQDDGWITVGVEGEVLRFWNHEPERARRCFEESGGRVGLPGHALLHAASNTGGNYCFCVSTDGPTPCAGPPPPGTSPLEQIKSHGGLILSPAEIRRFLQKVKDENEKGA
jgi:hypothetical protein